MVPCSLPELGPHQVPGEAVWHLYSHVTQRPEPRPGFPLGELTALPSPLACGEGLGAPSPRTPSPHSALWAAPVTRNRRLGPSQHDGIRDDNKSHFLTRDPRDPSVN